MNARLVAVALAGAAVLLDASGVHGAAALALVVAVPAAGIAGLQALADAVVSPTVVGQLRVVTAAVAVVSIVAAAALRAPLTGAEAPPSAAALALAVALGAFACHALVGGLALLRRQPGVTVSDTVTRA